jgi:hypothetical protein
MEHSFIVDKSMLGKVNKIFHNNKLTRGSDKTYNVQPVITILFPPFLPSAGSEMKTLT